MPLAVSALVLAAGSSLRMGTPKLLLPLPDRPAVRRCVESIIAALPAETVVVAPSSGGGIEEALEGLPVRVVRADRDGEMADSVRAGLRVLSPSATGVLVCPADHPLVRSSTVADLIEEHAASPGTILIVMSSGKRGHPTLFPRAVIDEIASGGTLRDVLARHEARTEYIAVDDDGAVLDMDTPEDYERMLKIAR